MAPPSTHAPSTPTPAQLRTVSFVRDPAGYCEPMLLHASQAAAWSGLRLGIFQAGTVEVAAQQGEHPVVAMILQGRTRGHIRSRRDDCDFCPEHDSVGLFAPRFDVSWSRWESAPGAQRLVIELDLSGLDGAGDLDAMLPVRRSLRQHLTLRDPQLAGLMRLIAGEVRAGSPHGRLYASSLSIGLAAYLASQHGEGGSTLTREHGTLTPGQKSSVLEFIQQRLADDIALDELAAVAGLSRFHFLRLFRNTLGVTPHQYVLRQRLLAARELIVGTRLPLAEVAATVGFSSQSHLGTAMKRRLGISPGALRKPGR